MSVVSGSGVYWFDKNFDRLGMSRWYVASSEIEGEMRREERKVDNCGDMDGSLDSVFRVSNMMSVSCQPLIAIL